MKPWTSSVSWLFGVSVLVASLGGSLSAQSTQSVTLLGIPENRVALEFVGQFNNTPTTSQQFGYVSRMMGLKIFTSDEVQDETTAQITFFTDATTDQVRIDGPLKIIDRSGTTTIYLNTPPSDFTNPDSFRQGVPIQISKYRQQVVLNTGTNSFSTVHMNTIIKTSVFNLNGANYLLGAIGTSFRTAYSGQSNSDPLGTPSGWFGGYAVGVN